MKFSLPFSKSKHNKEKTAIETAAPRKDIGMMTPFRIDFVQLIKDATQDPSDLIIKDIHPNLTLIYIDNLVNDQVLKRSYYLQSPRKIS